MVVLRKFRWWNKTLGFRRKIHTLNAMWIALISCGGFVRRKRIWLMGNNRCYGFERDNLILIFFRPSSNCPRHDASATQMYTHTFNKNHHRVFSPIRMLKKYEIQMKFATGKELIITRLSSIFYRHHLTRVHNEISF